ILPGLCGFIRCPKCARRERLCARVEAFLYDALPDLFRGPANTVLARATCRHGLIDRDTALADQPLLALHDPKLPAFVDADPPDGKNPAVVVEMERTPHVIPEISTRATVAAFKNVLRHRKVACRPSGYP